MLVHKNYSQKYYQKNKIKLDLAFYSWVSHNKERRRKSLKESACKYWLKNKIKIKKHRDKSRVKYLKYMKEYNRTHKTERQRYNKKHHDKIISWAKQWRKTVNGKMYMQTQRYNRRAGVSNLTRDILQKIYEENIKKYKTLTCELCFNPIKFGKDSIDHKIPISRATEFPEVVINSRQNLCVAHRLCNSYKRTKTYAEYVQIRG